MPEQESAERLQKVLARQGLGSRREVESWIRAGRLTVNGTVATLGMRVVPGDRIRLDGRPLRRLERAESSVFLCHRSPGESLGALHGGAPAQALPDEERGAEHSAAGRARLRQALTERLPRRAGRRFIAVSPMPRGDGGLELLSSDGELAARLQRAAGHLTSEFSVRVRGELDAAQLEGVLGGELDSGQRLEVLRCEAGGGEATNRWYSIETRGASGRELRQLLERQGAFVSRVLRTRFGSLALDPRLARGQFRKLLPGELAALLSGEAEGGAGGGPAGGAAPLRSAGSRSSRPSRRGSRGRAGRDRAR